MREAVVRQFPLDQYSYDAEGRPDAQNDPAVPAERWPRCEAQALVHMRGQNQHLHKVISAHCHDGCPENSCGEHGEELLPLQCQHGKQHACSQECTQWDPDCGWSVELVSDQQGSKGQEETQQQASHEEADAAHQHSDQTAQQAYTKAYTSAGFHAQLSVQHMLLVAKQEDDDGAEHQTRQEHDGFETAVTCTKREQQCLFNRSNRICLLNKEKISNIR